MHQTGAEYICFSSGRVPPEEDRSNVEKLNFTLKPCSIRISGFHGNIQQASETANSRDVILKEKINHGR